MNKLAVILIGLLGLAVVGYAFMGQGLMGFGPMQAWGNGMQGKFSHANMTLEDRAALLQASYEGNYDSAQAIMQKYGVNKTIDKALFDAQAKINQAILAKDWTSAVQQQDSLRTQMKQDMQAKIEQMRSKIASLRSGMNKTSANGVRGMDGRMGMRNGPRGFHHFVNQTNSTAGS